MRKWGHCQKVEVYLASSLNGKGVTLALSHFHAQLLLINYGSPLAGEFKDRVHVLTM